MKKFRKLIPALCMLLVSALFVGTSTYAWFSMNKTVTAANMQVKAKSNATYLLINKSGTAADGSATLDVNTNGTVYPSKYLSTGSEVGTITVANNGWYTANNKNSNSAADAVVNYKNVDWDDNDYMVKSTMYLTLSKDSEDWTKFVKVTATKDSGDASASIVLKITNGDNVTYLDGGNGYIDCQTLNLKNNNTIKVEVYAYIDGTSTNVYSDYETIDNLTGKFTLTFDLVETKA